MTVCTDSTPPPDDVGMRTVRWTDGGVVLIDQTALPDDERWITCRSVERVAAAIRDLEVRGAPAIGVTAAMGMALAATASAAPTAAGVVADLEVAATRLAATRPTAVNLVWAVDRTLAVARDAVVGGPIAVRDAVVAEACRLADDDVARCRAIGVAGAPLLDGVGDVVTHCNAGGLATVAYGTALGVIRAAADRRPDLHVWVDETRPVLQGGRLTAWELDRAGVACTVIVDGAAPALMAEGRIGAAVVGADRIAANGDVANKIGTYALAVAARHHGVPFYVAAPRSTIDPATPDGVSIEIEERDPGEIRSYRGAAITPAATRTHNPAFDVTPAALVTAIVTDAGVVRPPYGPGLAAACR